MMTIEEKKEKMYVSFTLEPSIVSGLADLSTNNSALVEKLIYDYLESNDYDLSNVIL